MRSIATNPHARHARSFALCKFIFLSLLLAAQVKANDGYAQNTVTLTERNVPINRVLKKIQRQTGYTYFAPVSLLNKAKSISIDVKDVSLTVALDKIFESQPLTYKIVQKVIIVQERGEDLEQQRTSMNTELPPIDVKGRVVNEKGEPVEGVTVAVKGTKKLTMTNANGEFSLETVDPEAVLVFTSVNMEAFEVSVSGKQDLVVNLKTKITSLNDVIVTTGYQEVPKERATGSFTVINRERLNERVATDIISKLEGISNGLVFNKSIDGKSQLRIRGESTIFANPAPLIVVDNFPYDGNIANLNPNDIESVTLLKDAAAASIWGVQAGNGVLVITTKKGRMNQKMRVEMNANYTVNDNPDIFYAPQINPADYVNFETFVFGKGGYNAALANTNKIAVSPVVEILNRRKLGQISASDSAAQIGALLDNDLRWDLSKYIYRKAIQQQYQMNLSGGTANASYYFSGGYDRNLNNTWGNGSNRVTVNSMSTFLPIPKLEVRAGLLYSETTSMSNSNSTSSNIYPYMQLVDDNGKELAIPQHREVFEDTIANHNFLNWKYYPLQERNFIKGTSKSYDTRLVASVKYSLLKGLSFDISYQYQRSTGKSRSLVTSDNYTIRNNMNTFAIVTNGNYTASNYPSGGLLDQGFSDQTGHYGRASLNLSQGFASWKVDGVAGAEAREITTENTTSRLYGYDDANGTFTVPNLFTSYSLYPSGSGFIGGSNGGGSGLSMLGTINRFRTYFGNMAVTYDSRYTLSGSVRFDATNYFGVRTNQKTVPLWSVGGKWNISNEKFYSVRGLPLLVLRATYGYQGNLAANLAAITTFQARGTAGFTGLPYSGINNVPNPDLRWEKIGQMNLGVDFAIASNRLSGSIEYFQKRGSDLIGDVLLDPTTGINQVRGNFSAMKSKGIDLQLISKNFDGKFKWNTTFIFNYVSEKVTKYDAPISTQSYAIAYSSTILPIVGKPIHSLFSYRWAGLDPANGNPLIYFSDTVIKHTAFQGNLLKVTDLEYSGRYDPPIIGSLINDLSFKGVALTFNIMYKLGHYFRRNSINYSNMSTNWQSGHADYALRWQKPGDELITNVPSLIYPFNTTRDMLYNQSNILVEKADHIRLQYVQIKYNLDNKLFRRSVFSNLQVYMYANNVALLWKANKAGLDPEYPYVSFPPARSYSIGVKATL